MSNPDFTTLLSKYYLRAKCAHPSKQKSATYWLGLLENFLGADEVEKLRHGQSLVAAGEGSGNLYAVVREIIKSRQEDPDLVIATEVDL